MSNGDEAVEFDIPQYLKYMLNLSAETYEAMWTADQARNQPDSPTGPTDGPEKRFDELLKRLYFAYEPKFNYTKKIDLPEDLEDLEDLEAWQLEDELAFEDKKKLVRKIRDLQEALGHTKYTRKQHEDKGVGGNGKK